MTDHTNIENAVNEINGTLPGITLGIGNLTVTVGYHGTLGPDEIHTRMREIFMKHGIEDFDRWRYDDVRLSARLLVPSEHQPAPYDAGQPFVGIVGDNEILYDPEEDDGIAPAPPGMENPKGPWDHFDNPDMPMVEIVGLVILNIALPDGTGWGQRIPLYYMTHESHQEIFDGGNELILVKHMIRAMGSHAREWYYPAFVVEDEASGDQSVYFVPHVTEFNQETAVRELEVVDEQWRSNYGVVDGDFHQREHRSLMSGKEFIKSGDFDAAQTIIDDFLKNGSNSNAWTLQIDIRRRRAQLALLDDGPVDSPDSFRAGWELVLDSDDPEFVDGIVRKLRDYEGDALFKQGWLRKSEERARSLRSSA